MNFTANVFHFFYIFPLTYASCRKIPGRRMNGRDYSQFHGIGTREGGQVLGIFRQRKGKGRGADATLRDALSEYKTRV